MWQGPPANGASLDRFLMTIWAIGKNRLLPNGPKWLILNCFGQNYLKFNLSGGHFYKKACDIGRFFVEAWTSNAMVWRSLSNSVFEINLTLL